MSPTSPTRRAATAAAWVCAGAIGATAVTGLAFAAAPTTGATTTGTLAAAASTHSTAASDRDRRARLRQLLHGELTIQGADGPVTVALQRGEVTAASASSVTVRSRDGFTTTYDVTSTTTVRRDRDTVTAADLVVGDTALVRAEGTDARAVHALSPEALAAVKDRLGQDGRRGLLGGTGG